LAVSEWPFEKLGPTVNNEFVAFNLNPLPDPFLSAVIELPIANR